MTVNNSDLKESFYSLSPDLVLNSVESALGGEDKGFRATGFVLPLNSIENRVYEIRFESSKPLIAKFYRPHRWSKDEILSEHDFLAVLADQELPVAAPLHFEDNQTLNTTPEGVHFAVFPKMPGRLEGELNDIQIQKLGLYMARIHSVGYSLGPCHRRTLDPKTYFLDSLQTLQNFELMPRDVLAHFERVVLSLNDLAVELLDGVPYQRIHGDCHIGNVLWEYENKPFIVDFDDMMDGPVVQDMWMLLGGRESEDGRKRELFLEAYEQVLPFDRSQLRLMELLRAMRVVYYSAWIARRWSDPSFPRTFPNFGTSDYWREEMQALSEIENLIKYGS